jgi:hypothetical protein
MAGAAMVAYLAGILLDLPFPAILALLGLCFVANVWMVIRILKDPYSTEKTFDEYFYEDREDLRRGNGD